MARGIAATGDLPPGVGLERDLLLDAERGGIADNLALILDDELALGPGRNLALHHSGGVGTHFGIDLADKGDDPGHVIKRRIADSDGDTGCLRRHGDSLSKVLISLSTKGLQVQGEGYSPGA